MFGHSICRRPAGSLFRFMFLFFLLLFVALCFSDEGLAGPAIISRASVDSSGLESDGVSWRPVASRDGRYVAFMSTGENLVPGDGNTNFDIFLRDTLTGTTTRVSTSSAGEEADSFSFYPSISDDGRYVAFLSPASNLIADDENGTIDIFVKDTLTGATAIASRGTNGFESNGISDNPSISGNGRYVAFDSVADSLVSGDTNGKKDVFVKDMQSGNIIMVSTSFDHGPADGDSSWPDLNQDGTFVTFHSDATDIVEGDTNAAFDVFVKNTNNGERRRVSLDGNGDEVSGDSVLASINDNGHYVAFQSNSTGLMDGDTNGELDIYVKYVQTEELWRASTDSDGYQGSGESIYASISGDGNFVSFSSDAPDLVPDDANLGLDVFVKHLASGALQRVSTDAAGTEGGAPSGPGRISADGRFVAYESYASNLVTDDTNAAADVFIAPVGRHYLFTWYDDISADDWLLMGNSSLSATDRWFHVDIDGEAMDLPQVEGSPPGQVPPGYTGYGFYGMMGGPVDVTSMTGKDALVSQRIVWGDYSLDEFLGVDSQRLSDTFYWTWYDQQSPGYADWVLVANPNGSPVYVHISIAGDLMYAGYIDPNQSITPGFPGVMGGPVKVQAWTSEAMAHPALVMASQRVLSNYGQAFNEETGIAAQDLSDRYLWTWYDQSSPGFRNWVLIGNENPYEIYYEITIAGEEVHSGFVPSGESVTPSFPRVMGGPVEVRSWTGDDKDFPAPVIASQRVIAGPSFEETPGFPFDATSWLYEWTWYDQQSAGMTNWVLVSNPNHVPIYYDLTVGGESQQSGWLAQGQSITPTFPGLMSGPVEVQGFTDDTMTESAAIFASQRVVWNGHFNEVIGKNRDPIPLL